MAELLPTGTGDAAACRRRGLNPSCGRTQPEAMTAAIARMNQTASKLVAEHDGVRPVEQGEGDSFVAAFARAGDAVGLCAGVASGRTWRRSSCGSGCTPAMCSYATRAITRARRSTRPLGCATSRTAARPFISAATEEMVEGSTPRLRRG